MIAAALAIIYNSFRFSGSMTSDKNMTTIHGFAGFSQRFESILSSPNWLRCQNDFLHCDRILTVGNGGNLAVCDHGAIDIARLTDKSAVAPGSGILASSLINDASHDLWVKNWLEISLRGLSTDHIEKTMMIGVSSSGYSKNICTALSLAQELGCRTALFSAQPPKIKGSYNTIVLGVDEYHTSEVLTLALFYQLIHGAGFICPTITDSAKRGKADDYKVSE